MDKYNLINKVKNFTAKIGIVGLGYVGLPLAVEKAKAGFKVTGFDIQSKKVEMINQGINYIGDIVDSELEDLVKTGCFRATTDFSFVSEMDCIMICVPTPIDVHMSPDLSYIESSAEKIARYLKRGSLIVLESTTYPGTTEQLVKPLLEQSGMKCGIDFFLAFSPERVDPGNRNYNINNTPKVVGGIDEQSTEIAAALYESVVGQEVFKVSSPSVAEMEKLLENIYRNINIALANEMAVLCHKMEIDVWEVIEAARTKPYGFMAFYPGPGIGGHCIPVDPFYLSWKAREYNHNTRLIEAASEINRKMPAYIVSRAGYILNRFGKPLKNSRIFILGMAYKQDIDDYRESPAAEVLEELEKTGAEVCYNDPYIPNVQINGKIYISSELTEEALASADLVIIVTKHTIYDYDFIQKNAAFIFDTKNAMKNVTDKKNIEKL